LKAYVAASMAQAHAEQKRRHRLLVGALLVFALLAVVASATAVLAINERTKANEAASQANVSLAFGGSRQ
jgi:cytochrome b